MSKLFALLLLFEISQLVFSQELLLGPGIWSLVSIGGCPNKEQLEEIRLNFDLNKHKLNRTHDGINANASFTDEINDNYAIYIEICKYVDGGCKPYHIISDDSMGRFIKKYSKDNMVEVLTIAKIDPPDFPLPKGDYTAENFVMDYCKLPLIGLYGKFEAIIYIIYKGKKVGCAKVVVVFNKFEDENYCDK